MAYTRYVSRTRPSTDVPFAHEVYDLSYVLTDLDQLGVVSFSRTQPDNLTITWTHICSDYDILAAYKQYVFTSQANTITNDYDAENNIATTITYDSPETELLWDSIPVEPA